ncbi:MAG: potassium-transporting ATPase subunit KdpA, partial [Planctomycetaceae bacterium]|nr:potassium-transporting ATPase subunit KdpA [Planctomycetaceae bacterium]
MRWFEYSAFLVTVVLLARPISVYLMRVFCGQKTFLDPVCRPVEAQLYRWLGVDPEREMTAAEYFLCFLAFGMLSTAFLFLILMFQRWLPGGPDASYLTTPMTAD